MLRWKDKAIADMDRQKLFRNSGAYILLGLSVIAMTFFGICSPKGNTMMLSGSAAKVAGEKISSMEFQRAYRTMSERLQSQYQDGFASIQREIPKYVMRQLVDERVSYHAALTVGVEAQDDDVVRVLKDAKAFQDEKGKFSSEAFSNYLRSNRHTEATFNNDIRRSLTTQSFRQFVNGITYVSKKSAALDYQFAETKMDADFLKLDPSMVKITVTPEDATKFLDEKGKAKVKTYFDGHPSDYNTKERVKARHILVSYTGARSAAGAGALRTKDDAKKRAEDVLKQVSAPGADFAKLATSLTDEAAGKARGGDLGFFGRDDMVKEFSEVAFTMKAGQISGVVESPFGFHIINVDEKQDARVTTLEQATNSIAEKLLEQEKSPALLQQNADAILADLKAGKSADDKLKALGAKWASTGNFALAAQSLPGVGGNVELVDAVVRLAKAGDYSDKVFDVRGSKILLRMKSRVNADETKLDAKKQKELARSAAYTAGNTLLKSYELSVRKGLEEKGKIWENPEYMTVGKASNDSGPGDDAGG
jgi:peptidyl-prolyl cis-trans isomerase D